MQRILSYMAGHEYLEIQGAITGRRGVESITLWRMATNNDEVVAVRKHSDGSREGATGFRMQAHVGCKVHSKAKNTGDLQQSFASNSLRTLQLSFHHFLALKILPVHQWRLVLHRW